MIFKNQEVVYVYVESYHFLSFDSELHGAIALFVGINDAILLRLIK